MDIPARLRLEKYFNWSLFIWLIVWFFLDIVLWRVFEQRNEVWKKILLLIMEELINFLTFDQWSNKFNWNKKKIKRKMIMFRYSIHPNIISFDHFSFQMHHYVTFYVNVSAQRFGKAEKENFNRKKRKKGFSKRNGSSSIRNGPFIPWTLSISFESNEW